MKKILYAALVTALVFALEVERHIVQLVIAGDGQRPIEARAADDAARQREEPS